MDEDSKAHPLPPGQSRATLEDLVYRSTLAEGNRGMGGTSPWLAIPVTAAVVVAFGGAAVLLARRVDPGAKVLPTVAVVLQEGPAPAAPAGPRAPAPAPAAPRPQPQAPAPAPPPEAPRAQPAPAPPDPRQEAVPEAAPRELPSVDQSRLYGGSGGAGGTGSGTAAGSAGGGAGGGTGGGGTGAGGHPGQVLDVDISQIKITLKPAMTYPSLARMAHIQGTVPVQLLVGVDGVPISARASSGPFQLRKSAEDYAMSFRFQPFRENGVALVSRFTLTVIYNLSN
jgi:outer membrane biosynthesis protein TonB